MLELDVVGVRIERPENAPVLILREVAGHRVLPIWIGVAEASAISQVQEGLVPPKPLTHDLFVEVLGELGHRISQVTITSVDEGTFIAEISVDDHTIPARPSDAVALALRAGADIRCAESVMDAAGVEVPQQADDEVERFREFLDHVSPDDFTGEEPGSPDSPGGAG